MSKGFVLWFTGLSGSGKTTLADKVYELLCREHSNVEKIDGDVLRGVFPSTGFTKEDRDEHIRRVGFMASLLEKHGVAVAASFISPYREARDFIRGLCGNFTEIYVSATLEECEKRDVKGLYKMARSGEIKNFTGIDDPYEEPSSPEIIVDTVAESVDESVEKIMNYVRERYL